ncbi:signal transduction histidine kinase [Agromyces ramosus]|uniref:histidine kinase n=1 Tax=Agromyces ramosus TaxID=33879 RepID=A0A4Q7M9G2_9MICO|nr:histidine kinase [Agromyces ramosus]RZS63368.1 signal transduction histidine kinase [Agromyces ramosus]
MSESVAAPVEGVEWVRPRPPRSAYRNDLVLSLVLAAGTAASVVLYRITGWGEGAPWWGSVLWVAAMNLPLAARRRWPEIVALVASAAFVVGAMAEVGEALFSNIALFIAIYTVGAWGRNRLRADIVRGVIVVGMFVWLFWALIVGSMTPEQLPDLSREGVVSPYLALGLINVLTNLLYFGGAWYFGDSAYRSARSRAELEQRTAELAAERERTRAQAVAIERLRIARELHDVVAHHVSVIGVQAGAARRVIAKDPDAAAASLSAIESSARDAVDELHGLLGTLRGDTGPVDAAAAESAEPPVTSTSTRGIDRIDELVAESVAAGLPTELSIVGEEHAVSPVIGLSAYRIAQEALTNVRKHAGAAATAEVRVRWSDAAVEVEVTNTGVARATRAAVAGPDAEWSSEAGGLGQLGIRERVAAAGGTLELGPRARGGYLVRARFPLRRGEEGRA